MNRAMLELVPATPNREVEWLEENCREYEPAERDESGIPMLRFEPGQWLHSFVNNVADPDVKFSVEWIPENEMPAAVPRC